jgi:hypothetical protein
LLRSCAEAVTDELLAGFLPRAHAMQTLDVAHCTALTDMTARLIASGRARGLRALRHVDVTGCHRITAGGRRRLCASVPNVIYDDKPDDADDGDTGCGVEVSERPMGKLHPRSLLPSPSPRAAGVLHALEHQMQAIGIHQEAGRELISSSPEC